MFQKAQKQKSKLRLALAGPSGSGKTYTALNLARFLGKKVAVIDSEGGSSNKYASEFPGFAFDYVQLNDCHPQNYINAIRDAVNAGYDVLIIDSLSHAWNGKNGILELVEKEKLKITNQFQAWGRVGVLQNQITDALIKAPIHLICTLRVKTAYVIEEENGKSKPKKVGLAPVQKEGMEYEFDIMADITPDNTLVVSKTRCPALNGYVQNKPGKETAEIIAAWLNDGVEAPKAAPAEENSPADASAAKPKARISLQTSSMAEKEAAAAQKAKKAEAKTNAAPKAKPVAKGIIEKTAKLIKIAEKEDEFGKVYGFILEGEEMGYRAFSKQWEEKGRPMIGKTVHAKALAGPNGFSLIGLELAS